MTAETERLQVLRAMLPSRMGSLLRLEIADLRAGKTRRPDAEPEERTAALMARVQDAEGQWLRFHLTRDALLAAGDRGTDREVADALGLSWDESRRECRTLRTWRERWRLLGFPERP